MTDEMKKQRKPSYTVGTWAKENGYTDAMLALLGDDAKKIMPAVKAGQRIDELDQRISRYKHQIAEAEAERSAEVDAETVIVTIRARLDAIKKAATGE